MDATKVRRFTDDLTALIGESAEEKIGLAVSGGPDSMAMLLLAVAAFPGRIEVATVDHRLRTGSAEEARYVSAQCGSLGVPHAVLEVCIPPRGNLSALARQHRYAALEDWRVRQGLDWIATAHHADDQLETLVMRLNRGAGVGGLAGIRARNGRIVRPLLGWRRAELAGVVAASGIVGIDDPTNHDDRFDRARLRKALAGADWLDPVAVAKSAALLAEAEAALDWAVRVSNVAADPAKLDVDTMAAAPAEIVRRAVLAALVHIDPTYRPRGESLTTLIAALQGGRSATLGGVACRVRDGQWQFTAAPPRRNPPIPG